MADRQPTVDETTRLLAGGSSVPELTTARHTHPERTVWLMSLLILFLAGSGSLLSVPQTRLVEDVLCRQYYQDAYGPSAPIDEHLCKNAVIQSELAYIMGLADTVDAITAFVVVLPYGVLADRIGRRFVLVLSSTGTIMFTLWVVITLRSWPAMPVRLIMLAPALQIVGGGSSVLLAMAYSLVADAVSEPARMIAFSRMTVASYIGTLLGTLTAARLMQVSSPWVPLLGSMLGVALGTGLVIFIPETLHAKPHNQQTDSIATKRLGLLSCVWIRMEKSLSRVRDSILVLPSTSAILVLLVFLCHDFVVRAAGPLFVQYISKRFHWTLAEAGYLLSVRGITLIFVLLIGLPALGAFLTSSHVPMRVSPRIKDLVLARISSLAMTLGALLMGAGAIVPVTVAGQVIMTLGDGLTPLCKTILASYVEADQFSTVYTLVSLVETVGGFLSGPALAGLFSKGMGLGGLWLGLPYFGLALICMCVFTLLLFVKPSHHVQSAAEAEVTVSAT